MATNERKRSTYFSPLALDILMHSYSEFEAVFKKKSNTAAAAKERESAWEKITVRVNA